MQHCGNNLITTTFTNVRIGKRFHFVDVQIRAYVLIEKKLKILLQMLRIVNQQALTMKTSEDDRKSNMNSCSVKRVPCRLQDC